MDLNVAATMRIMPEGPEVDLSKIQKSVGDIIARYGKMHQAEIKPVAFGLKALEVVMLLNDGKGGIDDIESAVAKLPGVGSAETTDVNRL
jgi:elongation factor 1-beta